MPITANLLRTDDSFPCKDSWSEKLRPCLPRSKWHTCKPGHLSSLLSCFGPPVGRGCQADKKGDASVCMYLSVDLHASHAEAPI